jgi:hypothetical protein
MLYRPGQVFGLHLRPFGQGVDDTAMGLRRRRDQAR